MNAVRMAAVAVAAWIAAPFVAMGVRGTLDRQRRATVANVATVPTPRLTVVPDVVAPVDIPAPRTAPDSARERAEIRWATN